MTTAYSALLGLALPVQGELSGTWGDTVNSYITNYLDAAVAGTQTLSTDANVTLTKATGTALNGTSAQYAIINCTGARTVQRTITVPATSKTYVVINATTGGFGVKVVGTGPTTGVTVAAGTQALVVWNGADLLLLGVANAAGVPPLAATATAATTATTATTATNLSGTTQWSIPYQSAAGTTAYLASGTAGYFLVSGGSGTPSWGNTLPVTTTINSQVVGYRDIPQNTQSAGYTCVLADAGKHIYMSTAGVYTIPANASVAFPIGTVITFVNVAGGSTIAITTDTMYLAGTTTTGTRSMVLNGIANAVKITATVWLFSGMGVS